MYFPLYFSVEQAYFNQRKLETEAKQLQAHASNRIHWHLFGVLPFMRTRSYVIFLADELFFTHDVLDI